MPYPGSTELTPHITDLILSQISRHPTAHGTGRWADSGRAFVQYYFCSRKEVFLSQIEVDRIRRRHTELKLLRRNDPQI